jgi:O-antigen/teichoic acid export membrane protein
MMGNGAGQTMAILGTIASRAGGRAVNLWVFVLLARTLSLEHLGLYGFAFSTVVIASSAFDLGTRNSVAYFIGKEPEDASTFAAQALKLWMFVCVPCAATVSLVLGASMPDFRQPALLAPVVLLAASYLFVRMMQGVLLGEGRIAKYNASELASRIVLLIGTSAFLVLDALTIHSALWTLAASSASAAGVIVMALEKKSGLGRWKDGAIARRLVGRGFQFMIAVLLMGFAKRVAFLILGSVGTESDAGSFYGVMRLTEVITEIGLAVAVVVFSSSVRASSLVDAVSNAARSTRVSLALFTVITAAGLLCADWILPLLLGEGFAGETRLFRLVLLGTLAGSVWTILFPGLSAVVSPSVSSRIFAPNVIVALVLTWAFYGFAQLEGVAWAYLLTNLALSATFLAVYRLRFDAPVSAFLILRREDVADPIRRIRTLLASRSRPTERVKDAGA